MHSNSLVLFFIERDIINDGICKEALIRRAKKRKPRKVVNKPAAAPEKPEQDQQTSPNQEDEQIVNTQEQDQAVNSSGRPGNVSKEDFLD